MSQKDYSCGSTTLELLNELWFSALCWANEPRVKCWAGKLLVLVAELARVSLRGAASCSVDVPPWQLKVLAPCPETCHIYVYIFCRLQLA